MRPAANFAIKADSKTLKEMTGFSMFHPKAMRHALYVCVMKPLLPLSEYTLQLQHHIASHYNMFCCFGEIYST